jgi:hypothetical protein
MPCRVDQHYLPLRLRVSGQQRPTRGHCTHRPMLHDSDHRHGAEEGWCSLGTCWYRQDRDGKGSGQDDGKVRLGLQLLRGVGL